MAAPSSAAILRDVFNAHVTAGRNLQALAARTLLDEDINAALSFEKFEAEVAQRKLSAEDMMCRSLLPFEPHHTEEVVDVLNGLASSLSASQLQRVYSKFEADRPIATPVLAEVLIELKRKLSLFAPDFLKDAIIALRKRHGASTGSSSPASVPLAGGGAATKFQAVRRAQQTINLLANPILQRQQQHQRTAAADAPAAADHDHVSDLRGSSHGATGSQPPAWRNSPNPHTPTQGELYSTETAAATHSRTTDTSVQTDDVLIVQTDAVGSRSLLDRHDVGVQAAPTAIHKKAADTQTLELATLQDQLALIDRANAVEGRALDMLRSRQMAAQQAFELLMASRAREHGLHPLATTTPAGVRESTELNYRVAIARDEALLRSKQDALLRLKQLDEEEQRLTWALEQREFTRHHSGVASAASPPAPHSSEHPWSSPSPSRAQAGPSSTPRFRSTSWR
jgi:hypothetical protein